ncbi:MAG TPA: carotenoid oxygenase family protein, partial [Steroidobacteraceae bacterium]
MLDPNVERKLRRGRVAQRSDITILDCEVEGKIPPELNGAFVRVGGEWFYPPRFADDAPLHADGYISAFRFNNGRASFQGKFVRTPRFEANLAAGRQLFGYYRNRLTDDPSVRHLDGTVANTAPVFHGGKLFALKEDALPYQIDPLTGEMIAYGYEATGPTSDDVFLYTIDREGNVTREVRFKVPYVSVMH